MAMEETYIYIYLYIHTHIEKEMERTSTWFHEHENCQRMHQGSSSWGIMSKSRQAQRHADINIAQSSRHQRRTKWKSWQHEWRQQAGSDESTSRVHVPKDAEAIAKATLCRACSITTVNSVPISLPRLPARRIKPDTPDHCLRPILYICLLFLIFFIFIFIFILFNLQARIPLCVPSSNCIPMQLCLTQEKPATPRCHG